MLYRLYTARTITRSEHRHPMLIGTDKNGPSLFPGGSLDRKGAGQIELYALPITQTLDLALVDRKLLRAGRPDCSSESKLQKASDLSGRDAVVAEVLAEAKWLPIELVSRHGRICARRGAALDLRTYE